MGSVRRCSMRSREVRNWLGIYFLLITGCLGGYILLFSETQLLPMPRSEATAAFQIIVPVLIGQLAIIFRWYASPYLPAGESTVSVPPWVVKGPPALVVFLMLAAIIQMAVGNFWGSRSWTLAPSAFRNIV